MSEFLPGKPLPDIDTVNLEERRLYHHVTPSGVAITV
ncbi:hypothetical protein HNQ09_001942 [Deinococcus budaensis]|uniref:Uncharacterized protein n=1 Tax=Deinococcus budaensis TaxID=1665626 RepID=A0A7W8GF62_9DEIO|nr:hypothetical protein [Deinococcus budaensis]